MSQRSKRGLAAVIGKDLNINNKKLKTENVKSNAKKQQQEDFFNKRITFVRNDCAAFKKCVINKFDSFNESEMLMNLRSNKSENKDLATESIEYFLSIITFALCNLMCINYGIVIKNKFMEATYPDRNNYSVIPDDQISSKNYLEKSSNPILSWFCDKILKGREVSYIDANIHGLLEQTQNKKLTPLQDLNMNGLDHTFHECCLLVNELCINTSKLISRQNKKVMFVMHEDAIHKFPIGYPIKLVGIYHKNYQIGYMFDDLSEYDMLSKFSNCEVIYKELYIEDDKVIGDQKTSRQQPQTEEKEDGEESEQNTMIQQNEIEVENKQVAVDDFMLTKEFQKDVDYIAKLDFDQVDEDREPTMLKSSKSKNVGSS